MMRRVLFALVAVCVTTVWLGCAKTETPAPATEQDAPASTETAEVVTVTLNVPAMH